MTELSRRAWVTIHGDALRKNLAQVRSLCPDATIYPVIKSNAYGHGMAQVAASLQQGNTQCGGLAVVTMSEALALKEQFPDQSVLVLNGFINRAELEICLERELEVVVHADYQVDLLAQVFEKQIIGNKRRLWLKHNSGMNRLGMSSAQCRDAFDCLRKYPGVEIVLMSHLACADSPHHEEAKAFTAAQLESFARLQRQLSKVSGIKLRCSVAASPGIMTLPESHYQIVRPGIMLYGGSPLVGQTAEELGLQPAMTLSSRLIAIKEVPAGGSIGYGATYTCERDTLMGVVSIGYGDGYPRAAPSGTPVLIRTASGSTRTQMIGRVSMDMITIDLSDIEDARIGDEIVLWGDGLCIDEIAVLCGTIAYELLCKVTTRVSRFYEP